MSLLESYAGKVLSAITLAIVFFVIRELRTLHNELLKTRDRSKNNKETIEYLAQIIKRQHNLEGMNVS